MEGREGARFRWRLDSKLSSSTQRIAGRMKLSNAISNDLALHDIPGSDVDIPEPQPVAHSPGEPSGSIRGNSNGNGYFSGLIQ